MKKKSDEIVAQIISLYVAHRFPKKTEGEFKAWLSSDVHRAEKDRVLEDLWDETVQVGAQSEEETQEAQDVQDTQEAFRKLSIRLELPTEELEAGDKTNSGKKVALFGLRRWNLARKVAAVLIPLLILGGSMFFYIQKQRLVPLQESTLMQANADMWVTALEVPLHILLPDNSRLWINAGSEVRYKKDFDGGRIVELSGEGYFDVQRNPEMPFKVRTEGMEITVLGTVFNVSDYRDGAEVAISLYEGSVQVNRGSESHMLTEKKELVYTKNKEGADVYELHTVKPIWLAEPTEYTYVPLSEILYQVAQQFGSEFDKLPEGVPDDTLSIYLDGTEGLEETLFRLAKLSGKFGFRLEENKIIIENK